MEREESGVWAAKGVTLSEVAPRGNKGGGEEAPQPAPPHPHPWKADPSAVLLERRSGRGDQKVLSSGRDPADHFSCDSLAAPESFLRDIPADPSYSLNPNTHTEKEVASTPTFRHQVPLP